MYIFFFVFFSIMVYHRLYTVPYTVGPCYFPLRTSFYTAVRWG